MPRHFDRWDAIVLLIVVILSTALGLWLNGGCTMNLNMPKGAFQLGNADYDGPLVDARSQIGSTTQPAAVVKGQFGSADRPIFEAGETKFILGSKALGWIGGVAAGLASFIAYLLHRSTPAPVKENP